jgi:hypothetical protein
MQDPLIIVILRQVGRQHGITNLFKRPLSSRASIEQNWRGIHLRNLGRKN